MNVNGQVFGPLSAGNTSNSLDSLNTSNQRVLNFINGSLAGKSELPPTGVYLWVDVRDVAEAHVNAFEKDATGRFLVTAGKFSNQQVVNIIHKRFPELADKLPKATADDGIPTELYGVDNSRSVEVLGLKYRSLETCVVDLVNSLKKMGA